MKLFKIINIETISTVQLARSVIAVGLILTLLLNDFNQLVITKVDGSFVNPLLSEGFIFFKFNLYNILDFHPLLCKVVSIIILLFVISGYFPQISSILHFWVASSFLFSSSAIDGGDQIHANISLLLMPICLSFKSVKIWKLPISWLGNNSIVPKVFIFLISLQMAIIYFHASVGKYSVIEWYNGTAVFYWFNHTLFGIPDYLNPINIVFSSPLLTTLITYSAMILEIILAGAIFMDKSKRKILFPFAVFFHFSIIMVFGIFSFFFSMLGGLIIYLLPNKI